MYYGKSVSWVEELVAEQNVWRGETINLIASENVLSARARRRLRAMAPQRSLDLHGKTAAEARALVHGFLRQAHSDGLEKVLIVHGKGLHSEGGDSVLKRTVQDVLRESRLAGETGVPPRELGGSGGTWVILRYRSR